MRDIHMTCTTTIIMDLSNLFYEIDEFLDIKLTLQ